MGNGFYKLTEEEWHRLATLAHIVRGTGLFLNAIELRFLHQSAKEACWNFGEELSSIGYELLEIKNNADERHIAETKAEATGEEVEKETPTDRLSEGQ